jgi:hypothetical protein
MATAMQRLGAPQRHGTGWRIPSAPVAGAFYFVSEDLWRCSYPGWAYGRGKPCRHIRLVRELTKEVSLSGAD